MSKFMRPALDTLAELRRGRLQAELTEALHDLLVSCQQTGKKGELVLKLQITPTKVGDYETPRVDIADAITVKKPRLDTRPSTFYLTDDGNPSRRDPNQEEFSGLSSVPTNPSATEADQSREAN